MEKFNSLFVVGKTKVQIPGEYGFRLVSGIHETRQLITVDGLAGSFQRSHILAFTNKADATMFPAIEDRFTTDQYGSVYERGEHENLFVGKLNGRTLKQFARDFDADKAS